MVHSQSITISGMASLQKQLYSDIRAMTPRDYLLNQQRQHGVAAHIAARSSGQATVEPFNTALKTAARARLHLATSTFDSRTLGTLPHQARLYFANNEIWVEVPNDFASSYTLARLVSLVTAVAALSYTAVLFGLDYYQTLL